jgi:branched-chain amino acid transport system permease protein
MYYIGVLTLITINIIEVTGYVLLAGFTGIFSLGHAGFIAIGAYVCSLLIIKLHVPWIISLLVAGASAGFVSLLIGKPSLRLKAGYFAIASMGFGESVRLILENIEYTGGPRGLTSIPRTMSAYPIVLITAIVGIIVIRNIRHSRFGRSFLSVRDDALAAEAMGIDTEKTRILSLMISAIYCGIGGAFYASFMSFIQPAMFDMNKSSELSTYVVFGGLGSLTGGIVAAFILTAIPEFFRPFAMWRMFFYGLALVLTISLRPQGLIGQWELSFAWLRKPYDKIRKAGKAGKPARIASDAAPPKKDGE